MRTEIKELKCDSCGENIDGHFFNIKHSHFTKNSNPYGMTSSVDIYSGDSFCSWGCVANFAQKQDAELQRYREKIKK